MTNLSRGTVSEWLDYVDYYEQKEICADRDDRVQRIHNHIYHHQNEQRDTACYEMQTLGKRRVTLINREGVTQPKGSGGIKKDVIHFTMKSRKALETKLYHIDWDSYEKKNIVFFTLTYPLEVEPNREAVKRDLDTMAKRLRRYCSTVGLIWKMEFTGRGYPHYHVIMLTREKVNIKGFREWLAKAWYEVVGSGLEKHERAGTSAEFPKKGPVELMYYMVNYIAGTKTEKPEKLRKDKTYQERVPEGLMNMGRWWGVINRKEILWVKMESKKMTKKEYLDCLFRVDRHFKNQDFYKREKVLTDCAKFWEEKIGPEKEDYKAKFRLQRITVNISNTDDYYILRDGMIPLTADQEKELGLDLIPF